MGTSHRSQLTSSQEQPGKQLWTGSCMKGLALFVVLFMLAAVLQIAGCSKSVDPDPDRQVQDLNTPSYFEKAMHWDPSLQKWITYNWMGSRPGGGCRIVICVRNAASHVPANFNDMAAKKAVHAARDAWVKVLRDAGITVQTITVFETDGENAWVWSLEPRIEISFESDMTPRGGQCYTYFNSYNRTFQRSEITISTGNSMSGTYRDCTPYEYNVVTIHELGHALGIHGVEEGESHSDNPNDVMFPTATFSTLTNGDKSTLRRLYTTPAYYRPINASGPAAKNLPSEVAEPGPVYFKFEANSSEYTGRKLQLHDAKNGAVLRWRDYLIPDSRWIERLERQFRSMRLESNNPLKLGTQVRCILITEDTNTRHSLVREWADLNLGLILVVAW